MQATVQTTTKARYQAAVKAVRASGVKFRFNVQECCRGCITPEKLGMSSEDQAYAFSYGGQGQRIRWDYEGNAYRGNKEPLFEAQSTTMYVNHGNDSAQRVVEAFENEGFDVEWDGNDYETVAIRLN